MRTPLKVSCGVCATFGFVNAWGVRQHIHCPAGMLYSLLQNRSFKPIMRLRFFIASLLPLCKLSRPRTSGAAVLTSCLPSAWIGSVQVSAQFAECQHPSLTETSSTHSFSCPVSPSAGYSTWATCACPSSRRQSCLLPARCSPQNARSTGSSFCAKGSGSA